MTSFAQDLMAFEAYAYTLDPTFGKGVTAIIRRNIPSALGGQPSSEGMGDAPIDFTKTGSGFTYDDRALKDTGSDPYGNMTASITPQAAQTTANGIADFFKSLSSVVTGTADAYYTTAGKIEDLKLKAKGSAQTQATKAIAGFPNTIIFWALLGIGGVYLLSRRND